MTDDFDGETMTMVGRDRGAHPLSMQHEEADDTLCINLTIPSSTMPSIYLLYTQVSFKGHTRWFRYSRRHSYSLTKHGFSSWNPMAPSLQIHDRARDWSLMCLGWMTPGGFTSEYASVTDLSG